MRLGSLKIAGLETKPNLLLAPMSGVTNSVFRRLMREENPGDLGLVVTEFVSVEGITRNNKRSLEMCHFEEIERPIAIQIFGHDIDRICDSARMVEEQGADVLDLNCGCPVPKVVRRGGGCELMRRPEHLGRILSELRRAVSIPLTIKIRAGWDESSRNAVQIARLAEDSGVDMVTVHGRTRKELYRGVADWDIVGEVARSVSIPVVGSGDITCVESAAKALQTGVSGLMIGRGALGDPWIFRSICAVARGGAAKQVTEYEIIRVLKRYQELLSQELPEKAVIGRIKQMAAQVTRRRRGGGIVRRAICTSKSLTEVGDVLELWESVLRRADTSGEIDNSLDALESRQNKCNVAGGSEGDLC